MTIYLNPSLTPEEIRKAANHGIKGVKSYPRGVTTNSDEGIESYTLYYPVFEAMQEVGMVLNLHGEIPSDPENVYRSLSVGRLCVECGREVLEAPTNDSYRLPQTQDCS
jgi:dihydroorotase